MSHPIVEQLRVSPEQEPAVVARGRDVALTAGAGTGKTRTLVARYLSLLAEGYSLRSIVAITFTEKAAREMRNRVRARVRRYVQQPGLPGEERVRWEEIYAGLDAARIGTIHGLCAEILRSHPAEAGIDPRFQVLDEGQSAILEAQALEEGMAWAANDPQAVSLFELGEANLRRLLSSLLKSRLDAQACLDVLPDPLWPAWERRVMPAIQAFLDDEHVTGALAELADLQRDGTLDRAASAGDALAAPLRRLLACWAGIGAARAAGDWPALSRQLAPLHAEMKQVGRGKTWAPADPKAVIKALKAAYDAQLGTLVGDGIDLALDRYWAEAMPAVRRLFERAVAAHDRLKQERQALDFDDLEQRALNLLHVAHVGARWQDETRALLVDEFQDTNGRQRNLVRLLTGEAGRLFIVGDAKQSIYRFRGADVAVFRSERRRIEAGGGLACELQTSYRAHRELVGALNDLLEPVLGTQADPDRPWAEPFSPLSFHRPAPAPGFRPPHVELHLAVGAKAGGALAHAAHAAAARIQGLVESGCQVQEGDDFRPLDYGDVAVLCRGWRSFEAYEDAFEQAGIPFLTVSGRGFYGRPEVRDVVNALRAVADPTDDLALAGLLRSPAMALPDTALYRLGEARDQVAPGRSWWEVLRQEGTIAGWPEEDRRLAARALDLIADLNRQSGRAPAADVLKAFLDNTGYRAALIQAGQVRAARNVSKLLADAHKSGLIGIGDLLEYIDALRDRGTREGEARTVAEGAVQIMTAHAAKGLEFPVIVLGDAGYRSTNRDSLLIDPELGPLWPLKDHGDAMPAVYRLAKQTAADQDEAEESRLLYVAATRAAEKLIVSGSISLKQDGTFGKSGGWLGRLGAENALSLEGTRPDYDEHGAAARTIALHVGSTAVPCTVYEPGWAPSRTPAAAELAAAPAGSPPPHLLAPVLAQADKADERTAEADRSPPRRVWQVVPAEQRPHAPAWVIGSLVHEALGAWRFPDEKFDEWAWARAREYGLTDPAQIGGAVSRTRRLLFNFRAHPLYREMAGADCRLHEVPYSVLDGGRVESGIIDAMYRQAGEWAIVEFKTDRVAHVDGVWQMIEREGYRAQALRYRNAAGGLLGRAPRLILCLLNVAGRAYVYELEDGNP